MADRKKIILVDDNMTNLKIAKGMLSDSYEVYPLPSAAKMFDILKNVSPDMILLDIEMPEMDGYEAIKLLKADEKLKDIPVIFLTAKDNDSEGKKLGAADFVTKPFEADFLLAQIKAHLPN
jgi:putative two-component system response regulator